MAPTPKLPGKITGKITSKILRLTDGSGWTCDVNCTDEQWAAYKKEARKERMTVANWLTATIESGLRQALAKPHDQTQGLR